MAQSSHLFHRIEATQSKAPRTAKSWRHDDRKSKWAPELERLQADPGIETLKTSASTPVKKGSRTKVSQKGESPVYGLDGRSAVSRIMLEARPHRTRTGMGQGYALVSHTRGLICFIG